jgi:putative Mg2+ transporter-C (MgtC) family protein
LTTAASIWITAAIGVLVGIGFYFPAAFATGIALGTLSFFRWIEARMPAQFYAHFAVKFPRGKDLPEAHLRKLLAEHGFTIANLNYRQTDDGAYFEYGMMLRSGDPANAGALSDSLKRIEAVSEFRIAPAGD